MNKALTNSSRKVSVELMRLIASLGVMLIHFTELYRHSMDIPMFLIAFVELFYIISGFLMMKQLNERESPLPVFDFLLHKLKSFYPVYIVAFALQFLLNTVSKQFSTAAQVGASLFHFKWEAILLQCAAFIPDPQFGRDYLMGSAWFLSAMMLGLVIAYPLAKDHRKTYTTVICPLAILLIYGYTEQTLGSMDFGNEFFGVISSSVLRAFAALCVGSLTYYGYKRFEAGSIKSQKLYALLEAALALCVVLAFFVKGERYKPEVLFAVPLLSLILVFCFADKTPLAHFLNTSFSKPLNYLGSLSLYLYLFHWPVLTAMGIWLPDSSVAGLIYCAITLAVSIIAKYLFDRRKSVLPVCVAVCAAIGSAFIYAAII